MDSIRTFHLKSVKALVISILITEGVGALSGFLTMGSMEKYQSVAQPPLSPPGIVFPIVWAVLYLLMGIAAYRIYVSGDKESSSALWWYGAQLIINFLWPIFFFNLNWFGFSVLWLVLLILVVLGTISRFYRIDRAAAWLLVPYLLWLLFALYLNIGVWALN